MSDQKQVNGISKDMLKDAKAAVAFLRATDKAIIETALEKLIEEGNAK